MHGGFAPLPERLGGSAENARSAAQHARYCADMVATKRTAPLAWFTWSAVGSADTAAVITAYAGMNGFGSGFAPTSAVAAVPDGRLRFTWDPGRFTDDYQVSAPILPRVAHISMAGGTYRKATYELRANGVDVWVWNAAGTLVNPQPGGTCVLW